MKTLATCFLLVGALVAIAHSYPASSESKSDDAEFIVVPLGHQKPSYFNRYPGGFDGIVDTDDFPHPAQNPIFFPSYNPFEWRFTSYLDDLLKRFRDRFAGSWNPFYTGGDFAPAGPGLWPVDIPDDSAEDGKTNTTSTVKVVDGHKLIINDTYYTKKTDFGTSIFKVRVIDVKPLDGTEDGGEETTSTEKPVDTDTRSGSDDESSKGAADDDKKEPTTEATKRDTEQDSDEDTTPADDNLNTIDSNSDIDNPKKDEVNTEASADSADTETVTSTEASPSPEDY